jgi:hypothetical protein
MRQPRKRIKHLVRHVGWYSTRRRGERVRSAAPQSIDRAPEDAQALAALARSAWARLIHKVHEIDPLVCARCNGQTDATERAPNVLAYHPVPDIA